VTERGALVVLLSPPGELVAVATSVVYPVHVDAELDRSLSRWLWLVKWVLAIPHFVVLALLWLAFALLSIVAFFAILFTGRYPRAVFDFNVGVLRWSWRVAYYAYGALGTDRYPPFTLAEVPDYPAHLSVDYPEHLSRGLVLVKWWLLAIPHYIVVALFVGGVWMGWTYEDQRVSTGGLIGVLVLVAAVVLAFTGAYPRPLYDFVLGMNRWVLRVAGYAGLMTDVYPPFRLDMGGPEPATLAVPPAPLAEPPGSSAAPVASRWTAGRIVAVVVGALVVLVASGLMAGGMGVLWADQVARGSDGYLTSPTRSLSTGQYALATERITLGLTGQDVGSGLVDQSLGTVRVRVTGTVADRDVFVGVARSAEVSRYLAVAGYSTVTNFGAGTTTYREHSGSAPSGAPGEQTFWAGTASGAGTQTLTWTPESGQWTVVVMNADASAGVAVRADIGATAPVLGWIWIALLVTGLVLLAIGAVTIVLAVVSASRAPAPGTGT